MVIEMLNAQRYSSILEEKIGRCKKATFWNTPKIVNIETMLAGIGYKNNVLRLM